MKAVGSTGGRAGPDPPAWLFGLGSRCQGEDLRNVAGSADTHIFCCLAPSTRGQRAGPAAWARGRSRAEGLGLAGVRSSAMEPQASHL